MPNLGKGVIIDENQQISRKLFPQVLEETVLRMWSFQSQNYGGVVSLQPAITTTL